jgi:TPR repeat protein
MLRIKLLRLLVAIGCSGAMLAHADFNTGLAAFEKGDFQTAITEWTPLAAKGDVAAQFNLGVIYQNARGVPRDNTKAFYFFRQAAEKGHAKAMLNVAFAYASGAGAGQNYQEAYFWMRKAADKGVILAQYNMGLMLYNGWGVARNSRAAQAWMELAARSGMEDAKKKLEIMQGKHGEPPNLLQ